MNRFDANEGWPEWWFWPLKFTSHLLKRMQDRDFDEVDLRTMLESAAYLVKNHEPGRWTINTVHRGEHWEVIVEPNASEQVLIVITAYPVHG